MALDTIREQLDRTMGRIPEFTKSTRGNWLYNAVDTKGEKVKVQFKGNNFKVSIGSQQTEVIIKSVPLSKLKLEKVESYLKWFLIRKEA
jgi:hypothetical protein